MRTSLFGVGAWLAAAASVAVISAQSTPPSHHGPHQVCAPHGASGDAAPADHAAFLAVKLELTSDQRTTVARVSDEACAAMVKYHQQILDVLTPEQQAKLNELHGAGQSNLHAWFRKLHGGR